MNKNAEAWVKALRSGNYEQGTKHLRVDDKFCCLGVACDLYQAAVGDLDVTQQEGIYFYNKNDASLPIAVTQWLGFASKHNDMGRYKSESGSLAIDNDTGVTFKEIADTIVLYEKELFA